IHAVVRGEKPGVIFVLKNTNEELDTRQNRLQPFYLVYIGEDGEVISNHMEPKQILDTMRYLSRGKNQPDMEVCRIFNKETKDGRNMEQISNLLQDVISSIITVHEENDLDSFFGEGETSFLTTNISGLDDFELIC